LSQLITRRGLIVGSAAAAGSLLTGCARVDNKWPIPAVLDAADAFTRGAQRLLLGQRPLARELSPADISAHFPLSGTFMPKADTYKRLLDEEFASWRLRVHGLVERPLALSLADLRSLPARTQITLHQCDEGWSAVAQWTGVPLAQVLALAGLQKRARYVVFHCLDRVELDGAYYYESLDLLDAANRCRCSTERRCGCALSCRSATRMPSTSTASSSWIRSAQSARVAAVGGRISTTRSGTRACRSRSGAPGRAPSSA
jgi:DMSO/TMAO reductase YedYZ molybdopterin-dependent catalytic subunit